MCNYVNQALLIAPLVGVNAKSYYPQLQSIDISKKSYSKMNMYGGYFENVYSLEYEGGDGEDEETGKIKPVDEEEIEGVDDIYEEQKEDSEEQKEDSEEQKEEPISLEQYI